MIRSLSNEKGEMRKDKVKSELKKEISSIIHNEVKDPRLGFITVIDTELSDDLKYLKVFYSVLGAKNDEELAQDIMERVEGFIKKLIAKRLKLRFVPEIKFIIDRSIAKAQHIEDILENIKHKEEDE